MLLRVILALLIQLLGSAELLQSDPNVTDGEELGLLIVGAITNKDKVHDSVALVKETKSGKVSAVKKGFRILENYIVEKVTAKYIVIRKAKDTFLVYQNKFAKEFASAKPTKPKRPIKTDHYYSEEGFERKGNQIRLSQQYRNKLIHEELSTVLMQATAVPEIVDGKVSGFRLLQIDKGSIYDKAGLQNGDIVTAINDTELNSVSGAVTLLKSLRNTERVSIRINRDGQEETLRLEVAH